MKQTRLLSRIFAVLGAVLIVGTIALSFLSLEAPARVISVSGEARECTEDFMEALAAGDYPAAGSCILGQPELRSEFQADSQLAALLWDAYTGSIRYEFTGDLYVSGSGYSRDVTVTALDIPALMAVLKEQFPALLAQKMAAAGADAVYEADGSYREEFLMEVLCDGAAVLLPQSSETQWQITLQLTHRDGQWWILPEQSLMGILAGGLGN